MNGNAAIPTRRHSILPGLIIELALAFVPSLAFLSWYAWKLLLPSPPWVAHLYLIGLAFLAFLSCRLMVCTFPLPNKLRSLLNSSLFVALWSLIWVYYALVATGLNMWGRVVSLDLVQRYSGTQLIALLDTLGVSPILLLVIFGLIVVGMVLALSRIWRRWDWVHELVGRHLSRVSTAALSIMLIAIVFARLMTFSAEPELDSFEPFSLTFFSQQAVMPMQGFKADPLVTRQLNIEAEQARLEYPESQIFESRNVVLIVVDGLRADRMGVLGADRETTPFLSALRNEGKFSMAGSVYSSCAESVCGLLAINASIYPHHFSDRLITLSEVLMIMGYEVHHYLSGDHTNFYNVSRFYGPHDIAFDGHSAGRDANDDRVVLERLSSLEQWSGSPTMIKMHLMSAHNIGRRWGQTDEFAPAANYTLPGLRDFESALNYYDNGVLQTDRVIQEALQILEQKGYLKDAVVVITGDHGELLGEHGAWGHAKTLYEPVIRVPFLLLPRWGQSVSRPLIRVDFGGLVDVAPSIAHELGLRLPATWRGLPLQQGSGSRVIHLRQGHLIGRVSRLQGALWKYWLDLRSGEEAAFNLLHDPNETTNLVESLPPALRLEWRRASYSLSGLVHAQEEPQAASSVH
ncbi:sulfatase-like hydrolase/transferase [Wenzhouxiangella marina]|nr:sulfatase-like hydrolase/transferase [Wenzhouxiangella marina]MBB6085971.1 glucan phosphoethanolaminetransferase (alkaline phosphatase superfamily) [Wenzhouxiangella marina]